MHSGLRRSPLWKRLLSSDGGNVRNISPASGTKDVVIEVEINQAPNRAEVWSKRQRPRGEAFSDARFMGIYLSTQPQPLAAIELLKSQPVEFVNSRVVSCDGGSASLGHPKVFINLVQQ